MIQFDEHIFQMGWFKHQLEEGVVGFLGGEDGMEILCGWAMKPTQLAALRDI